MITMYSQAYSFVNWSVKLADTYLQSDYYYIASKMKQVTETLDFL